MSDGDALFRAILDDPDDVARRLVYADWLEEQPDERSRLRGEFIRVEHRLMTLAQNDPEVTVLSRRHTELSRHCAEWFGGLDDLVVSVDDTWCGFPDAISIRTEVFVRDAKALFALAPIREIAFIDRGRKHLAALAACPWLSRVRRISFSDESKSSALSDAAVRTLAASPFLCNVEDLFLVGCNVGPSGMESLAASRHLGRLRCLDAEGNRIRDRGAMAIAAADHWERLGALNLRSCGITLHGLRALAGSGHLRGLADLGLQYNTLGPGAGDALATACWHQLRTLDLYCTGLTCEGLEQFGNSPCLDQLRTLRLATNEIRTPGLEAVFRPGRLQNLEYLDLATTWLDAGAMQVLTRNWPPRLRSLRLDDNRIGDEGAAHLARGPGLTGLETLLLRRVGLGDQGVRELAESPYLASLRKLVLVEERLTDAAVDSLVASPYLSEAASIDLTSPLVTAEGFRKLNERFRT